MKNMTKYLITIALLVFVASPLKAEHYSVFLEQEVSKSSLYVGEQALYNLTLNTQTSIFNYQPPELSLEHAWSEVVAVNQRYQRIIEGQYWNAFSSRRAIYPLRAGTLEIPKLTVPIGVRIKVRKKVPAQFDFGDAFSDDFLEQFFADVESRTVQLEAPAHTIEVKALPPVPADLPAAASGYIPVGATSLSARASDERVNVGESITLEVNLVSVGNLNPINDLNLKIPEGIRVYPEAVKNTQNENNGALIMRRNFRFSLVPISPGTFELAALKVPYFDTESGTYKTAETSPLKFQVAGIALNAESSSVTPATVPTTSPTNLPPAPTAAPADATEPEALLVARNISPETVLFATTTLLMLTVFITSLWFVKRRKRPFKQFRRQISSAVSLQELSEIYRTFLISHLGVEKSLYSYEELTVLLKRRHLGAELEYLALNLLDTFEQARFSPDFNQSASLSSLKSETLRVASGILAGRD